jgi:DNA-binding transcriptional LysR family regulator
MDIRHLVTFATVQRSHTFLATARALGYSQSTVTLHIQELERELGVELFERVGKRVVLTEAGHRLDLRAGQILDALGEMKRDMASLRSGGAGMVRLGVIEPTASLSLPAVVAKVSKSRPGLELRMEVGGTESIARRVAAGELEFGITTPPAAAGGLSFEPLFEQELVLAIPRSDALARRRSIVARDLVGARMLLTEQGCAYRGAVEEAFTQRGHPIRIAHEIGSMTAILGYVRLGLGVGIVPLVVVPRGDAEVIARRVADVALRVPVGLITRHGIAAPSPATVAMVEEVRRGLKRAAIRA